MRTLCFILFGLVLTGCSDPTPGTQTPSKTPAAEKEAQFERDRLDLIAQLARAHSSADQAKAQVQELEHDYEQRLKLKSARIKSLEAELKREKAAARKLKEGPEQEVAFTSRVVLPENEVDTSFPVHVSEVAGTQVIVGTNSYIKTIETEELYRDEFGNKRPVLEYEDVATYVYAYRVACTLDNRTDQPVLVELRAGVQNQTVTLEQGESGRVVEMGAAKGSSLMVMVGGHTRRFDVSF